jgi:hypothetical protein
MSPTAASITRTIAATMYVREPRPVPVELDVLVEPLLVLRTVLLVLVVLVLVLVDVEVEVEVEVDVEEVELDDVVPVPVTVALVVPVLGAFSVSPGYDAFIVTVPAAVPLTVIEQSAPSSVHVGGNGIETLPVPPVCAKVTGSPG